MPFSNPIVGGTTLIRPAIHSPDFVTGASGWSINRDGSAEFNDLVVRGDGGDTVIVGSPGSPQVILGASAGTGYIRIPTNRPIEDDPTLIAAAIVNSGAADEYAMMQIQGPSVVGANDRILFSLTSQANDGSRDALLWVRLDDGGGTFPTLLQMSKAFTLLNKSRLNITPDASASSALFINAAVGHTGNLLRLQLNGADRFVVDPAGDVSVEGTITQTPTGIPYKPVQIGTATVNFVAQTQVDSAVVFPVAYPVGVTPVVVCSRQNSPANSAKVTVNATGITNTGFTMRFNTGDGTAVNITGLTGGYHSSI